MREMTTSKTPWISEYPTDWDQVPLHALFGEHKNKNKDGAEQNLLSLSYGNIIRKDINTNEGLLPESFNGYNIIDEGDIVLRLTDLQNDHRSLRTGLVKEHGIITSAYVTLRKKAPLSSEYYHYLLHAFDIMKVFYSMGEGIRQSLGYDELAYTIIPKPPIPEQQAIVRYLDSKCSAIDEAIERHKKIIEKLEEYRRTLVSNVVLHGLHSCPTVHSDLIPWVKELPAHWATPRIRDHAQFINGDRSSNYPSGNDIVESGIPFLTSDNLWGDIVDLKREKAKYITKEKYNSLRGVKLQINDIVYCLRGSVGKCAINTSITDGTIASSLTVIRPTSSINAKYLLYVLNSSIVQQQNDDYMNGSCAANLAADSVRNYRIVLPSPEEQSEIVEYLDAKAKETDGVIKNQESIIAKLEEYRKSIIYNAVTGKIDCREATK